MFKTVLKRYLLAALLLVSLSALVFAGGGQSGGGTPASGTGKQSLLLGLRTNSFITDYDDNYLTNYVENMHNIDLTFYLLPDALAEFRTKVSLMVAAGDLPDVLFGGGGLTPEQILDYGSKGAFIPLNKYLENPALSPNFAKIPAADREVIINTTTSADGNIYSLSTFACETRNLTPSWIFFNKAWADKLGVKVPTTTDELKSALIAFRDRDPNGNGRKDEIGLYAWVNGGFGTDLVTALLNSFIFYNKNYLSLDASGNKVIAPFTEAAFRKGLVYLNDLFKEGLLVASSFTDDQQTYRSVLNQNPPVVGITSAGMWDHWPDANKNVNFNELQMIPPLTGPDGVSWTPYTGYNPTREGFVTSKAKNPDLAFKFAESFYSSELSWISRYGEEDVDWSRKPEQTAKVTNVYVEMKIFPALTFVTMTDIWSTPSNKFWHGNAPRWAWTGEAETKGMLYNPYDPSLKTGAFNGLNWTHYMNLHPDKVLPTLKYNLDDAVRNAEVITNINQHVQQAVAEFVTGIRDVNSDTAWNTYLRELNGMGLEQWLSSAQATYDRQR